jgi:UDP-glucose 4-epimerase
LRISGVYDDECHSIPLSQQIQRIYEKQFNARVFAGHTDHGSDYIHMEDLVDAIMQCVHLRKQLPNPLVLLIGEGKTYSYDFLQKRISELLYGSEITTHSLPKSIAKFGAWVEKATTPKEEQFIQPWMIVLADDHYDLDISKAKKILTWEPKHSLERTLPLFIQSLKNDPIAWYHKNGLKMPAHMKKHLEEKQQVHK